MIDTLRRFLPERAAIVVAAVVYAVLIALCIYFALSTQEADFRYREV